MQNPWASDRRAWGHDEQMRLAVDLRFIHGVNTTPRRSCMKLVQIVGKATVSDLIRHRIETNTFRSVETAAQALQRLFPHHVVVPEADKISVRVKDKSLSIAVFQQYP